MAWNGKLVSFLLHMEVMLPFTMASKINVAADQEVVLCCPAGCKETISPTPNEVVWNYNGNRIIRYMRTGVYKGDTTEKYKFVASDHKNFSLWLPNGKEGQYTCIVNGKEQCIYDLRVWTVPKEIRNRYLLRGETVLLEVISSGNEYPRIEWFSPRNAKVTGNEPRWELCNSERRLQIKNLEVQEDDGTWKCHILPDGPWFSFGVKVIDFLNVLGDNGMTFATIDSRVVLSCPLNIDLSKEKNVGNFPELQSWELMKDNKVIVNENLPSNANSTYPAKEITNVRLEDAGKYQCRFIFAKGNLNTSIHLIVMSVSGSSLGLHADKENMPLCCHISASLPATAELCWAHTNETRCQSHLPNNTFCEENATTGTWTCSLKVENNMKISINYTVAEEPTVKMTFPLVEILSGVGALLLLLILAGLCGCDLKPIRRKRQRARRMAQAKQHLLEKKTCQCERELTNDYYHA
uniref:Ig-like domain-containing protein n=1 Tax=Anolis carolinensis TaxID=28377 RepID=A0A803SY68_ANOCA|nr:PREDICTED: T-cell surface glycoprotein CD4 isoform X1 [Anolis carolinensis]XP_008118446.1 PREDICTED: T-cell surface glycoprotein CD4 isoform X1 [Anolis carolinensis]XP_008118447.1 PREDICTED: T-cell surface glycoprotein CD4 isoform X1 [Anolis carolinensis]XP_008118448.1 PREDICTED: T-cell surface glycoprotein CD4 isoform X1 [Anolis carolinensis]XP_016852721.1 PREDICTED: T-cell surface glycoprotein CD4 isoform X1 [Anolis carolinensis]|eukprot:XP_008118445.1 PREDICTED: T-cell surface glycoprotein CD4 isoform X1 [Anolis carolinensis]